MNRVLFNIQSVFAVDCGQSRKKKSVDNTAAAAIENHEANGYSRSSQISSSTKLEKDIESTLTADPHHVDLHM